MTYSGSAQRSGLSKQLSLWRVDVEFKINTITSYLQEELKILREMKTDSGNQQFRIKGNIAAFQSLHGKSESNHPTYIIKCLWELEGFQTGPIHKGGFWAFLYYKTEYRSFSYRYRKLHCNVSNWKYFAVLGNFLLWLHSSVHLIALF